MRIAAQELLLCHFGSCLWERCGQPIEDLGRPLDSGPRCQFRPAGRHVIAPVPGASAMIPCERLDCRLRPGKVSHMPQQRVEHPRARETDLLSEPLGDELLVFDSAVNRAHSLNATAAAVWRASDGTRSREQIAEHCQLDPVAVELALDSLADARLLAGYTPPAERVSRRTAIRRMALTGATVGIALPVIRSIVAPSAAMAGSTPKTSRNPRNGKLCHRSTSSSVFISSSPCSPGSVCHNPFVERVSARCQRSSGASCFHGNSNSSSCNSSQPCPSTGVCPPPP